MLHVISLSFRYLSSETPIVLKNNKDMYSDEYFNGTEKNPWDQVFMRSDNDGPKNEDYKISSSLKTIWSDASDSKTNSFCNIVDRHSDAQGCSTQTQLATEYVQFGNNVIAIECDFQSKPQKPIDTESYYNTANNNVNPNLLKGRPITSRNGGYVTHFGTENQVRRNYSRSIEKNESFLVKICPEISSLNILVSVSWHHNFKLIFLNFKLQYSSQLSDLLPHQKSQPLEAFLQKVQVIVKNGFLDPKILHEPISPETFDLIQMLIFYVMVGVLTFSINFIDDINFASF